MNRSNIKRILNALFGWPGSQYEMEGIVEHM